MTDRICQIDGCERQHFARGWCHLHYTRWWKNGDPLGVRKREQTDPAERFWAKFRRSRDGCWEWTGALDGHGYGHFYNGTKVVKAYRWSYEHFIGPVPDGLHLDHLCRNRACVNPHHLEPVTQTENVRRGASARGLKTHCKRGHEFTPENTLVNKGWRHCRQCAAIRMKKFQDKRRATTTTGSWVS